MNTKKETQDAIKYFNRRVKKQDNWIEILQQKIDLEEQLSVVRVKIIKQCISDACVERYRCKTRIAELQKPSPKNENELLPKRYKKDAEKIFEIIKRQGNNPRAIVKKLKEAGIIAPSTYWADVSFLKHIIKRLY